MGRLLAAGPAARHLGGSADIGENKLRADCMNVHERVEMVQNHMRKCWVCPICGASVSPEQIEILVPQQFLPQTDPIADVFQQLADYEIVGVLQSGGRIFVEYPRRDIG